MHPSKRYLPLISSISVPSTAHSAFDSLDWRICTEEEGTTRSHHHVTYLVVGLPSSLHDGLIQYIVYSPLLLTLTFTSFFYRARRCNNTCAEVLYHPHLTTSTFSCATRATCLAKQCIQRVLPGAGPLNPVAASSL